MKKLALPFAPLFAFALSGCPQGTGAFAPDGGASALIQRAPEDNAAAQPAPPLTNDQMQGQLPPGHPQITGHEDAKELMAKIEAMKAEIKDKPKTVEILLALGNLYYENARYLDAIDYYRQTLDMAKPGFDAYQALPDSAKKEKASDEAKKACARGDHENEYAQLAEKAKAFTAKHELGAAAYCWRSALIPAVTARARRGNAYFLSGNSDLAVEDHRAVLALDPDFSESLFYLGAILYDGAGEDVKKLEQARDAWKRFLEVDPQNPRAQVVKENLPTLEKTIANGGKRPAMPQDATHMQAAAEQGGGEQGGGSMPTPGAVNQGAAEAIQNTDVGAPGFMEGATKQIEEGEAMMDAGDWEGAREAIKGFMPIFMMKAPDSPLFPRVLTDMGEIYGALGNKQMGSQMLNMAIGKDPGNARARAALAAMDAGGPWPKTGAKPAKAEAAADVQPVPNAAAPAGDAKALAKQADAEAKRGNFGNAIELWNEVVAQDPYLAGELRLKEKIAAAQKKLR